MTVLAIDWSVFGVKAGQFVLSFSILVILHELGHFLPARWFGCRVEKFYLFFNPWFSIASKKIGETEYGLGWIPFGGYVKISGMVDESMDKEQMKQPAQSWEFRSKPAWQRLIIMLGGVTVNVILALVIFIMITWVWGERYLPMENLRYGIYADSLGKKIGLMDGDRIIAVGGKKVEKVGTTGSEIVTREAKSITVERDGKQFEVPLPKGFIRQLNANRLGGFTYIRFPLYVDSVDAGATAALKQLQKGDRLIQFNNNPIEYSSDYMRQEKDLKDKTNQLTFLRANGDSVRVPVTYNKKGESEVFFKSAGEVLGEKHISYGLGASIPKGIARCFTTLQKYVQNLKQLFTSKEVKVSDSLGSVISIGGVFPGVWDWESFWTLTAIFSIILAFMNVLPIPALDGGHALFTLYEMITGKKPSDKFMEYAQMVGMFLLLGLMAYALGLDIWRLFK
jgi:regulator of sigma E protease